MKDLNWNGLFFLLRFPWIRFVHSDFLPRPWFHAPLSFASLQWWSPSTPTFGCLSYSCLSPPSAFSACRVAWLVARPPGLVLSSSFDLSRSTNSPPLFEGTQSSNGLSERPATVGHRARFIPVPRRFDRGQSCRWRRNEGGVLPKFSAPLWKQ